MECYPKNIQRYINLNLNKKYKSLTTRDGTLNFKTKVFK